MRDALRLGQVFHSWPLDKSPSELTRRERDLMILLTDELLEREQSRRDLDKDES